MNYRIIFFFLVLGLVTWSCTEEVIEPEPDPVENNDAEVETAMQDAIIMENVISQSNQELEVMALTVGGSCPEINQNFYDGNGFQAIEWTYNFGSGCTSNGVTRTGTAWVRDSMFIIQPGSPNLVQLRRGITYDGYVEDEVAISGFQHHVYEGNLYEPTVSGWGDFDSLPPFKKCTNLAFIYPDGTTSSSISNETSIFLPDCWPNAAAPFSEIIRSKSGVARNGKSYQTCNDAALCNNEVIAPILQAQNCPYPAAGIIQIDISGLEAYFNYGQCACNVDQSQCGCDDKGQLTLPSGETKIVTIKKWW